MSSIKSYVLDTNVLIHDPEAVFKFEDNDVFIPIHVIEEIDKFKGEGTERGRNCRQFSRVLDELRKGGTRLLSQGVPMGEGKGVLTVFVDETVHVGSEHGAVDRAILQSSLHIKGQGKNETTIFVTMDTNLRIRADAVGMLAETYENSRMKVATSSSILEIDVPTAEVDAFFHNGGSSYGIPDEINPNASVVFKDVANEKHTAICRFDKKKKSFIPLKVPATGILGIKPKNREQAFAFDLLLDENIQLLTLIGKAGTGKTLLAVAAGLQKVLVDQTYTRMLVSRPVMPLGKDIGFLPGTLDEKMSPWMQPIFDNLEFIFSRENKHGSLPETYQDVIANGQLQVEPLTYIRGRSLPEQYLIVDEAQNLTSHEIKTIITRAGDGTKIILTGDPEQIDNPYVDATSNGLSVVMNRFAQQTVAGNVILTKGERSKLAELASDLLLSYINTHGRRLPTLFFQVRFHFCSPLRLPGFFTSHLHGG